MERKEDNIKRETSHTESNRQEREKHNPFRDADGAEPAETPEEEAAAEQQRKEALTERD